MFSVELFEKKEIAKDTWQFIFKKPKEFSFQAGQYVTIFLEKDNRDFTICADPSDAKIFSIVTKAGKSDFKKRLFMLSIGSEISMNKPAGGFTLNKTKTPKVFLAGGIGMTVFYSIICSNKNIKIPITLIASFSKKDHMIFYDELQNIQKKNKNIKIIYTLSQDMGKEEGRISERHIKKYVPNLQEIEFMIAGGEQMVYDTEEMLLKMKVAQEKIRLDIFTGY